MVLEDKNVCHYNPPSLYNQLYKMCSLQQSALYNTSLNSFITYIWPICFVNIICHMFVKVCMLSDE